jgi:outer membrane protein insertion porin family
MHRTVSRWVRALGTGGLLALIPSWSSAQNTHDQQREAPEVRNLSFTGVKHVDQHDLSKHISTRESQCRSLLIQPFCWFSHSPTLVDRYYLDRTEFRRDVLRIRLYYWKRGYRDAIVDTTVVETGPRQVHITFAITEGEPTRVRKIAISYDTTLMRAKTRNRLTLLHAGDPLDLIQLDSMRVMFQNALWDEGYGDAVVDTTVLVDPERRLADVGLLLTANRPTTIGRVTISGNDKVSVGTILNSLTFNTGDLYRRKDILQSQRNLYESNLFRLAAIDVPPQYDSVKNVNIDVTEAPMHDAQVGPGFSNLDFLQVRAHYSAYNLLGGARRLDIDGTVGNLFARSLAGRGFFEDVRRDVACSNDETCHNLMDPEPYLQPTYNASINFRQPAFLQRPPDQAAIGAFAHRTSNPGVFIDRGYGGQVTATHVLAPRTPISLNYRYELNRVEASDVYFCVNFGVCDTPSIGALRSHQSLSPLTLTGFIDRSDEPFSPTKGYVTRLDLEHASGLTLSDYRYNRAFLDAAIYGHKSGTRNVYSAHLRLGFVRPLGTGPDAGLLHPRKRFYAGGANSVRGYAEGQLGPRVLTIYDSTLIAHNAGNCAATMTSIVNCDPNAPGLSNNDFVSQPLGGTSLIEGSVEYRFPLDFGQWSRHFVGAVFVDGGIVGSGTIEGLQSLGDIIRGTGAITPGFGFRYESPVGPIRVDFGINPNRTEELGVVTAVADASGRRHIVPLRMSRLYTPGHTFLSHLVLHFSIGEAY